MFSKLRSLSVISGVIFAVLLIAAYFLYAQVAVIKVAAEEFTYEDIEKNFHVETMVADVVGGQSIERSDVAYNLTIVAIQKQLLINNQVTLQQTQMVDLLEQSTPFKGLYKQIKDYLGDDYFRLFIEPIAVGQLSQSLFDNNNPRRAIAEALLQQALEKGFDEALAENGITPIESTLNIETSPLAQAIVNWAGTNESDIQVFPNLLELNDSFIVAKYKSQEENNVIIDAVPVTKLTYKDFMVNFANSYQPMFSWFSWYSIDDFKRKQNSIF